MKIVITNLSNNLFDQSRKLLNISAAKVGINTSYSYQFETLSKSLFFNDHFSILSQPKGLGYWLWKPYIILEAFKLINDNDIVVYSDCGIEIISDLKPLITICNTESDILLFANSNFVNSIWTKRDCFVLMDCDEKKYWNGVHCDAAFCLFKKSPKSQQFLEDWLRFGSDANIITDLPNICGKENFPDFLDHRWDQSILSLLAIKNNLPVYRMPTQFGNHYKIPAFRIPNEFNCLNQLDQAPLDYYAVASFTNSAYPQLLDHHRKKNQSAPDLPALKPDAKQGAEKIKILYRMMSLLKRVLRRFGLNKKTIEVKPLAHGKISYSQCGEDLIIDYIFKLRGVYSPSYIDIGAHHPWFLSNTALFYLAGGKGINIEANPYLLQAFESERKNDTNLNIGIGTKNAKLDFYILNDDALSTFSKEDADQQVNEYGRVITEIKSIGVYTLQDVLNNHAIDKFPDLLSIDVEGLDYDIIESFDFSWGKPKIICAETADYSSIGAGSKRTDYIKLIESKGYHLYADTNLNSIFVENNFWFI